MSVEIFSWNPKRPLIKSRAGRFLPFRRRVNNFGDLLGPLIVRRILSKYDIDSAAGSGRLLSIGSVLHFARDGDVIWGSGLNGKVSTSSHQFSKLDVRAVRGPLTRAFLLRRGIRVPPIFGDPALLLPIVMPELGELAKNPTREVTVIPNLNDYSEYRSAENVLRPTSGLRICLRIIAESRLVVGSALHGLIVAESLGIPARAVRSVAEPKLKYADYYLGTGRMEFTIADSVADAFRLGGESHPQWSSEALLEAFPFDLWSG